MKKIVIMMLAVIMLSGCGSQKEPKDRVIVGALAVSAERNEFEISAICYNPSGEEFETITVKAKGASPAAAFSELRKLEERLYFGHLESVVVEKTAAESSLTAIAESLACENISDRVSVFVYSGDPAKIFESGADNAIASLESLKRIGKENERVAPLFYIRRSAASSSTVPVLELQRYFLGEDSKGNRIMSVRAGETVVLRP